MREAPWMARRHRAAHVTIRDIDCADFDADGMIRTFEEWGVSLFSFFAGGYVTTYPTALPWQRMAPGLDGRDLCGAIVTAARRAGILAFPMSDLGEIPEPVAAAHDGWAARRHDGTFFVKTDGIVTACSLGGYVRGCSRKLVAELARRYRPDGIKFGGASYGFPPDVCHCAACAARYPRETGRALPRTIQEAGAAEGGAYRLWREARMRETIRWLMEMVREAAGAPGVGNIVWRLGDARDMEDLSRAQDFTQVEVQTRMHVPSSDDEDALDRHHVPLDIVSTAMLPEIAPGRYAALVAPSPLALSAAAAELARHAAAGTGIVVSGLPEDGAGGAEALAALTGARAVGAAQPFLKSRHTGPCQAYIKQSAPHALFDGIGFAWLAVAGPWRPMAVEEDAAVVMRRVEPFRLFPEGLAFADAPDPDEPMAAAREAEGGARTVQFAFQAGRCARRVAHPDNYRLIANAVRWAARGRVPLRLEGFPDVLVAARAVGGRTVAHLINTTGRHRYLETFAPVRGLRLEIAAGEPPARVWLASSGGELRAAWRDGWVAAEIPELVDYDLVVVE